MIHSEFQSKLTVLNLKFMTQWRISLTFQRKFRWDQIHSQCHGSLFYMLPKYRMTTFYNTISYISNIQPMVVFYQHLASILYWRNLKDKTHQNWDFMNVCGKFKGLKKKVSSPTYSDTWYQEWPWVLRKSRNKERKI